MSSIYIPEMHDLYMAAYLVTKGWTHKKGEGWVSPDKKIYFNSNEPGDIYWDLDDAYWETWEAFEK